MSDLKGIQTVIAQVFREHFGTTPLRLRLDDIDRECRELLRFTDLANLREETGDLLASLLQLCNEAGWSGEELVNETLAKIRRRADQYKSLGRKIRIALLGGAFDPVHNGHIALAQLVLNVTRQDEVWLTPCFTHLGGKVLSAPEDRLEMIRLACQDDLRLKPFDYEIRYKLGGETYNFLRRLKDDPDYENYQFSYIIGQDNADTFDSWYNHQELERLVPFIVTPREGYTRDEQVTWYLQPPHAYIIGEKPLPRVASRDIRPHFPYSPHKAQDYLNRDVLRYIMANGLYNRSEKHAERESDHVDSSSREDGQ